MVKLAAPASALEVVPITRTVPANTFAIKIAAKTPAHWDSPADPMQFALPKTRLKPASVHLDLQVCQLLAKDV
jgi:hypothetical protein